MPASITRGTTITSGGSITSAALKSLIESATISGIDRENIDRSQVTPMTTSSTAPATPAAGEIWMDSTTYVPVAYDSTNLRWKAALPHCENVQLSASSASVTSGALLKAVSQGVVALADGGVGHQNVVGIAAIPMNPGDYGVMIRHGVARIATTGTVDPGMGLRLSSTSGVAEGVAGATSYGPAIFARALIAASGGFTWSRLLR